MKIITSLLALLITCSALASTKILFTISHTDNSLWQFNNSPPSPENPTQIQGTGPVGTNAVTFNGHLYSIDVVNNILLVDGGPVGHITWNGNIVDVTTHYGWCIQNGQGYLASQYNDGDPQNYLFQVNLSTAVATYIDYIGPVNPTFSISGMTSQPVSP